MAKSKMKVDWTILYCETMEEMENMVCDKSFIWPLIVSSVRVMIKEKRTSIVVLEGKLMQGAKDDASVWITMSDGDVEPSLKKALKWREEREEYEECSDIMKLLSEWNEYKWTSDEVGVE